MLAVSNQVSNGWMLVSVCCSVLGKSKTAFVTFKDPKALEIALLLSVCLFYFVSLLVCYV